LIDLLGDGAPEQNSLSGHRFASNHPEDFAPGENLDSSNGVALQPNIENENWKSLIPGN